MIDKLSRTSNSSTSKIVNTTNIGFLIGGGKMGRIMRSFDWSKTAIGETETWAESLRTAVSIMLNSPLPMFVLWDKNKLTNLYNDAYSEILGSKHPTALAQPANEVWAEIWNSLDPLVTKAFKTGEPVYEKDLRLLINRHGSEEETYFTFSYSPLRNDTGSIVGLFCVVTETTDDVLSRQILQESEERFRTLIERSADAVQLVSLKGEILFTSDSVKHVLGYTPDELAHTGIMPFLHPEDTAYFFENFNNLIKHPDKQITMQYRVKHKDGSWAWLETVGVNHINTPNIHALLGNFRNITKQKEAEDRLRSSNERFRALAENIPNLAWMADAEGYIFWYNNRWYEYTGTKPKEMEGWGWQTVHDPEHLPNVLKRWKHSIKTGKPFEMVFPLKGYDGNYRPFLTRVVPLIGDDGKVKQWIGTNTDISEQQEVKRAEARNEELEKIARQLAVQRKELISLNKTKDEFIGMASHQLRTPATAVKQYISLLIDEVVGPLNPEQLQFLHIAYDSNERELNIIHDLLKTAQMDSTEYTLNQQRHDIVRIVSEAINDMKSSFEFRKQEVSFIKPGKPIRALVDETEMKLVFVNLLENASKYSYHGTKIKVAIEKKDKYINIVFTDKGVGISKDDQQRIFEKFTRVDNSLSDTVTGTGLGLYWVKQLIGLHNGTVKLTSSAGKGSKFAVRLPR